MTRPKTTWPKVAQSRMEQHGMARPKAVWLNVKTMKIKKAKIEREKKLDGLKLFDPRSQQDFAKEARMRLHLMAFDDV